MSKALSIRQPWAELILQGRKTIETRRWKTNFRGTFYIHAPKKIDLEACKHFGIDPDSLSTSALLGKAEVVDVKEYDHETFRADAQEHQAGFYGFEAPIFGFVLRNIERLNESVPAKGSLNFFEVDMNGE